MYKLTNPKKFVVYILPLILLILGIYFMPVTIFNPDFSKVPGDFGDTRFNNYILEHGYKYITFQTRKYWDAPFMFPFHNVIAFSDNLLGTVPVYSLFRLLGCNRETAYQVWLLTMMALNFICCYWALFKWFGNPILAATAAYVFAFSIFILGHIYNVQNFPRFIVPWVFYWLWQYLSQKSNKHFLWVVLGVVYQFYCGIYLGFFLIYCLIAFTVAYILIYRDGQLIWQFKKNNTIIYHVLSLVVAGLLMAPLMKPYLEISKQFGMRRFEDAYNSIPTLRSYFFSCSASVPWQVLSTHGIDTIKDWWCHFMWMGIVPWLGLITVPLVWLIKGDLAKRKLLSFLMLSLSFSFIFTLRIGDFTLYKYVFMLPGFSSMRGVHRVINVEVILFLLVFVVGFVELGKRFVLARWLSYAFPLLVILDNLINPNELKRFAKNDSQMAVGNVKERIKLKYDPHFAGIAFMPNDKFENATDAQLNVMLACQELNIPCVNAYTGAFPGEYNDFFGKSDEPALSKWCQYNNYDFNKIQQIYNIDSTRVQYVSLKAFNQKYLCADEKMQHMLIANRDYVGAWETLALLKSDRNMTSIRTNAARFVAFNSPLNIALSATEIEQSTKTKVRVITLEGDTIAFRTASGKYLSVDVKTLFLNANATSVGPKEKFKMEKGF